MMKAMSACEEAVGPKPRTQMTAELAAKVYAAAVARGKCLTKEGFDVGEVPSRSAYVDALLANDPANPPWDPYEALPKDPTNWAKAVGACPDRTVWGDYEPASP